MRSRVHPVVLGSGSRRIAVLSALSALPQKGEAYAKSLSPWFNEFQFWVFDSLEGLSSSDTLSDWIDIWSERLSDYDFDAYVGLSFGGGLLQYLSVRSSFRFCPMVLISSPTHVSEKLKYRLSPVYRLLKRDRLLSAIKAIHALASETECKVEVPEELTTQACERMRKGLELFFEMDTRSVVRTRKTPLLYLLGRNSRLVTQSEVAPGRGHQVSEVGHAEMRLLEENPKAVMTSLKNLLNQERTLNAAV